jgi:polysaccharide deacetylase family protein (PEP-CTERM system associated)
LIRQMNRTPAGGRHFFTVDVEEHFQVSAFESVIPRETWSRQESRVVRNVDRLLDLLDGHGKLGTFFVLGCVAERHPDLVRRIAAAGHEIASHGHDHRRVTHQAPDEFRQSVRTSKAVLEEITGVGVLGFRAPSFSIVPGREWAFDILLEEGYRYDSSIFPIRRSAAYGYPSAPRDAYTIERPAGQLLEFPLTTLRRLGWNLPASGGAYFRIFPYEMTRAALADCDARGSSGVFYVHPWEIDPEQPRVPAPISTRFRHYRGLERTMGRMNRLLRDFRFGPIGDHVEALSTMSAV